MSIILRTNKGKALSYDEMDRNQSQFFYSSSLHNDNTRLRLHYTGSENLDTATEDYGPNRYQEINLPALNTDSLTATAAGNTGDIQFNTDGQFDALGSFKFDRAQKFLGIGTGTPEEKLDIHGEGSGGASINLKGSNNPFNEAHTRHASINFYESSTYIGQIGRVDSTTNDLYFTNNFPKDEGFGKVHIGIGTAKINPSDPPNSRYDNADNIVAATFTRTSEGISRVGIGTKIPNRQLSLVGEEGIGISPSGDDKLQSFLSPLPFSIYSSENGDGKRDLIPNNSEPRGLFISSPTQTNGGNIVVAINTDSQNKNEGFNIINSFAGEHTNSEVIFSAQASGKVGINTNFPSDVGLTVEGHIETSETLKVGTLDDGASDSTSAVVATSTGLFQKIAAAPVPIGGIIMWSGTIANKPAGWELCDGETYNGITAPDLRNKFIVGANADNGGAAKTTIEGTAKITGGSKDAVVVSHTHGGTTASSNASHSHKTFGESNNQTLSNNNYPTLAHSTGGNAGYRIHGSTGAATLGKTSTESANHNHTFTTNSTGVDGDNKNLPPYYALAFIIYVGA